MRIRRTPATLSVLTALALVLSACGGSDEEPAATTEAAEQEGPLGEYFTAIYGGDMSPEEQEREFAEDQAKREELVAQCMQEEGFEYRPDTQSSSFSSGDADEWQPDEREWVSQYGYGAVKSPFSEEPSSAEEYVDPNADYVATLSESEQTAFYEALYGVQPTEEEIGEDGEYEYDWQTAGCQGAAQHEVDGEDVTQSEEFRPLIDAIQAFYEDTASLPDMAELDAEWAACMDAAGHGGFATQTEAQNSLYDELNAIYEATPVTADGVGSEPDQAALDALAEREVELALADLDCREETDYRDRYTDISHEAEQQFVDDHKSELEAMKAAAEQD